VAALSIYLDASVLVSMFVPDMHSSAADRLLRTASQPVVVSDLAAAEFASGISQLARTRTISAKDATAVFFNFDEWSTREAGRVETQTADIVNAGQLLRRLNTSLRTPDAIHIEIARRIAAQLMTFDKIMASAARALGLPVVA
jgi:predicted nucleic acid-binding protein